MKITAPKPFTYEGGKRAVLLLHGFTGNTKDVRMLGRYLQERHYTCHAPIYRGHGQDPETLIASRPSDWWEDVMEGYRFLREEGYREIAVAGVSLGGTFSLKLGMNEDVKGLVSMCAPVKSKSVEELYERIAYYAHQFKKFQGKTEEQIKIETSELKEDARPALEELQQVISDVGHHLSTITCPTLVLQGALDGSLYKESAEIIYEQTSAEQKTLTWYEQSGHIITLDQEREQVYEEVYKFLEQLKWEM